MKISAIKCKKCGDVIYSRAAHDFRSCSCGTISIDGGFGYSKVTFKNIDDFCNINLYLNVTLRELYDDWNRNKSKYGLIKSK